jgi:hypothetical protein
VQRREPLKEILSSTRALWDHDGVRPSVRSNFTKVLKCRTDALGSEVYGSETEQMIVHHTCKSRACPSCGYRATRLWQREMWAALPDVTFAGVVLTMPDILWPIFKRNRHLLDDLPALGAAAISGWAKEAHGARVMILVVRHTFGRHLNFNPHLHILVSSGGLRIDDDIWISGVKFDRSSLMKRWRFALITYLREALRRGLITSNSTQQDVRLTLKRQYERWWNIDVQPCATKEHFLRYAGRYVRRPPLAQYRIVAQSPEEVVFRTKDHRLKTEVLTRYPTDTFIDLLADHVPDHYTHAIRHFGLLSPRMRSRTFGALFAQLEQHRRAKPRRLAWSTSIEREFGKNPRRDSTGEFMKWICRNPPSLQSA